LQNARSQTSGTTASDKMVAFGFNWLQMQLQIQIFIGILRA